MGDGIRWKLADKIFDALQRADLGARATIERLDDGTVLGVDVGDPEAVYLVTVSSAERSLAVMPAGPITRIEQVRPG